MLVAASNVGGSALRLSRHPSRPHSTIIRRSLNGVLKPRSKMPPRSYPVRAVAAVSLHRVAVSRTSAHKSFAILGSFLAVFRRLRVVPDNGRIADISVRLPLNCGNLTERGPSFTLFLVRAARVVSCSSPAPSMTQFDQLELAAALAAATGSGAGRREAFWSGSS